MVVSVFDDDTRLAVHLCELACDETDDPVFEIVCIIEEYWETRIDMRECLFELRLSGSLSGCVEVLEFREESIGIVLTCEEPTEGCKWCIHATSSIDSRSYLESDNVSIIFSYLVPSFEELTESTRARVLHSLESESRDGAVLSDYRHTVRDCSEGGEVHISLQDMSYGYSNRRHSGIVFIIFYCVCVTVCVFYGDSQGMYELKGHSCTCEVAERIDGIFSLGIDDSDNFFWDNIRDCMMIRDDDIDSEGLCISDRSYIASSTIDGDYE